MIYSYNVKQNFLVEILESMGKIYKYLKFTKSQLA